MKKWMTLMRGFMKDGLLPKDTFGDWCVPPESPELIHSKDPARQTDRTLLGTAYFYLLSQKMSEYAKIIDRPADAKEFDGVPNKLEQFFSPNPGQGDDATNESDDGRGRMKSPSVNAEHPCHGRDP